MVFRKFCFSSLDPIGSKAIFKISFFFNPSDRNRIPLDVHDAPYPANNLTEKALHVILLQVAACVRFEKMFAQVNCLVRSETGKYAEEEQKEICMQLY